MKDTQSFKKKNYERSNEYFTALRVKIFEYKNTQKSKERLFRGNGLNLR